MMRIFPQWRRLDQRAQRDLVRQTLEFGTEKRRAAGIRMAYLLLLSTLLASCGMLANSAAAVIGAMLVAPIMKPMMSASVALVLGWSHRLKLDIWSILVLSVTAPAIAFLVSALAPDMVEVPAQVMDRTRPTYFDLVIALSAGAAGAYTMVKHEAGAIPGVAMAVSLLPPLAAFGILLELGEPELALRALILYCTNLLAMILSSTLTLLALGFLPAKPRREYTRFVASLIFSYLLLLMSISIPLYYYSRTVWFNSHYEAARSVILQEWLISQEQQLVDIDIDEKYKTVRLTLTGQERPGELEPLYQRLQEDMREDGLDGQFEIIIDWHQSSRIVWPPR